MRHDDAYDGYWPTATVRRKDGTTGHRRLAPDALRAWVREETAQGAVLVGGTGDYEEREEDR